MTLLTPADYGERLRIENWRRGRDSNPRYGYPYAAFRVRCIQPLCHLSITLMYRSFSARTRKSNRPLLPELLPNPAIFDFLGGVWQAETLHRAVLPRRPASCCV